MNHSQSERLAVTLLTLGAGLAVGAAVVGRRPRRHDPEENLVSYLVDHLTGSDAALTTVARLALSREDADERRLFCALKQQFESERAIVRSVLGQLGSSAVSLKRAAGYASGAVLQAAAGGAEGSLAMFRTLESLLIGVQGKRCLWRTLQAVDLEFKESGDFKMLERQALEQWERIEALRQSQLRRTFSMPE